MKISIPIGFRKVNWAVLGCALMVFSACNNDDDAMMPIDNGDENGELMSESFFYGFNDGQLLGDAATAYDASGEGSHPRTLSANLDIEEMENGMAKVTVTLMGAIDGLTYHVHAHDAKEPGDDGLPYDQSPNADVFADMIMVNGETGSASLETSLAYSELIEDYEGFLVVHDPTQEISTTDLSTYLILGVFGEELESANLRSSAFNYAFNEGQALGDPGSAYGQNGEHPRNVMARLLIEEKINGDAFVTVTLENTLEGESYAVHAHDMQEPGEDGLPYNQAPNSDVFARMIMGNGSMASATTNSSLDYEFLIGDYEAFFVVHDPTQDISTTDLSTYLILGAFAESLEAGRRTFVYDYSFNEGQLLDDPATAYEGPHERNLGATLSIEEMENGMAKVSVSIQNAVDGEMYPVHAHDAQEPGEDGLPYDQSPNGAIFAQMLEGMDGMASGSFETDMNFDDLVNDYEGFFVIHDPLQDLSTSDLTTFLVLDQFAR